MRKLRLVVGVSSLIVLAAAVLVTVTIGSRRPAGAAESAPRPTGTIKGHCTPCGSKTDRGVAVPIAFTACSYTSLTTYIHHDIVPCPTDYFQIGGQVQCNSAGTTGCTPVSLYAEVWEKINGTWSIVQNKCITSLEPNCGQSIPSNSCFSPSVNLNNGDLFEVYVGWRVGICNPTGTVVGVPSCLQYQTLLGYGTCTVNLTF